MPTEKNIVVHVSDNTNNYGSVENPPPDLAGENKELLEKTGDATISRSKGRRSQFRSASGGSRSSFRDSFRNSIQSLVDVSFSLPGKRCSVRDLGGTATIPNEVFNLVKNLVGCGVLALPSGVAAFADAPSAMISATVIILVMGGIFGYYFLLLGKICKLTMTATYREAWEETVGEAGSEIVALVNTIKPGLANLAYSMILADTFQSLFLTAGLHLTRTECLLLITVLALLPLCLLKNLNKLAPFSIIGLAGMCFTALAMAVRYFDGTYDSARGGKFLLDIPEDLKPSFGRVGIRGGFTVNVLVFVCMVFEAFVAHYNAPRFYVELKQTSVKRFGAVVGYSFGISAAFYVVMTAFGFLTFGANSDGFILNNYSTKDSLATMCRVAIAIAIIFTYPIVFIGMRDGVLDLLMVPVGKQTSWNLNVLSIVLLVVVTVLAAFLKDLGIVNAVGGGTLATALVFIFPALMYKRAVHESGMTPTRSQEREAIFAMALMWIGILMGVVGVWIALKPTS